VPKVRKELGYPPLVTPMSQLVGIQAVMNVLSGKRYSMIPKEKMSDRASVGFAHVCSGDI
jgi:pyruvate/oxaloacetate carboxyltransferase